MILYLHMNNFSGLVPDFTIFSSLRELNLSTNKLSGSLPSNFERLSNLVILNLDHNQLTGSVLDLSRFRSLELLNLQNNQLNGTLHVSLGQLSRLSYLDISSNSLKGEIGVLYLSNLSRLRYLDMSFNSLSFNVGSSWMPSFKLDTIGLAFCRLGPRFPNWLRTQSNYSNLDISYAGIYDTIPFWFWNLSTIPNFISLSHNNLHGNLPAHSLIEHFESNPSIDLSSNLLEGTIPNSFKNSVYLNLSRNAFCGSISFVCNHGFSLNGLDLSHNFFSGKLPDCWSNISNSLTVVDLSSNSLTGKLGRSLGSLIPLKFPPSPNRQ